MSVKFFGQFLLERGVVGRRALLDALDLQEARNRRIGAHAVRLGYLSEADVERINRLQLTQDKRFGELALELGLLTPEQVPELLSLQRNDAVLLGEALVELGHVERPTLERELGAFADDQAGYLVGEVIFPPGVRDPSLLAVPVDLTVKLLERLAGVSSKLGEGEREVRPPVSRLVSVTVSFSGGLTADYTLSLSTDLAARVAERILGEAGPHDEATTLDAVKELANVVCGNAAAKLAQVGRPVEIGPPASGAPRLERGQKFVLFPLHVPEGAVEVRIRS